MVYLLNTNLNNKKKVHVALHQIYGIGKYQSLQLCNQLGISLDWRIKQMSHSQLENLTQLITSNYDIGIECRRLSKKNIQRLVKIGSYRGFRFAQGLPVRGQRTHGNSRTVRRFKLNSLS